jgi:Ca2+-transporting ATPase
MDDAWHETSPEAILDSLETDPETGLGSDDARQRLEVYGPNEIREHAETSALRLFLSQFQDTLIFLLIGAAVLSLAIGLLPGQHPEYVDAALIALILLANGIFGFVQDYRAEKSIEVLREMATPNATVVRGGERLEVDATGVVPGDIVLIEQGDAIPADARVIEDSGLETDESALTGESASVSKDPDTVRPETPLAERTGMIFMNTTAVAGRGRAVVVETGMETEVGSIATQLSDTEETETPFQQEIDHLGRQIGFAVVALIAFVALTQFLFTAASPVTIALVAITLAVAAVPEGLPAVVSLTLAMGARKLLRQNALVRRLSVVESLGAVDTILTDKTGTLTESRMTVTRVTVGAEPIDVSEGIADHAANAPALQRLLRCGACCVNAERAGEHAEQDYFGDPTEIAILRAAHEAGIEPDCQRLREIPFSSERKRMTVVVEDGDESVGYSKGAPKVILDRCDRVLIDDEVVPLTDDRRAAIEEHAGAFATDALRVLAFATKAVTDLDAGEDDIESGMVFLGFQGLIDPPRDGVREAIEDCRDAGIRVVMATGDNVQTARAIGAEIGFDPDGALTGSEIEQLNDEQLRDAVEDVEVFARTTPAQKVRLLEALQDRGHRVAMTGDGVNDAPALQQAAVGIAMGQRGTDVARQAADMVLQDDNFVTIRNAIAAGRGIFDNIRKFVNYLLSANAGEVFVVFAGVLLGTLLFPETFTTHPEAVVLTPVMLLWVNLVTDGLPALALGADPIAEDVMDRPPRPATEGVIDRRVGASIGSIGVVMMVTGLTLFFGALSATENLFLAQTTLFTFLVVVEMVRIQLIRSRYNQPVTSNPWLLAAIAVTLALQALVLYSPLHELFDVVPLGAGPWGWIAVAFVTFVAINLVVVRLLERLFPATTLTPVESD